MNWKTYPMGAAACERMELRGLKAHLSHAVAEPCDTQVKALCGVKTFSLCMDSSLATTEMPDCPVCRKKIVSRLVLEAAPTCSAADGCSDRYRVWLSERGPTVMARTKSELRTKIMEAIA